MISGWSWQDIGTISRPVAAGYLAISAACRSVPILDIDKQSSRNLSFTMR
jgi:hypothetical protein